MRTNQAGIDLIKAFEGFSADPYICPAGVPTIGYGSTWAADGHPVTMDHPAVTEDEAEQLLRQEIAHIEKRIGQLVRVDLNKNRFGALVSFVYNIGSGNFQRSTMRMKLNRRDYAGAAEEFGKWRRGGGRVLPGLVRRRAAERSLFLRAEDDAGND